MKIDELINILNKKFIYVGQSEDNYVTRYNYESKNHKKYKLKIETKEKIFEGYFKHIVIITKRNNNYISGFMWQDKNNVNSVIKVDLDKVISIDYVHRKRRLWK